MHILTASTPIDLGAAGELKPGRYLVENNNAAEMLVMAERGTATLNSIDLYVPGSIERGTTIQQFDENNDWNGKRVLFMRSGGFGDMLYLIPIFREMRRCWPKVSLSVACRKERFAVFDGLGLVNGHVPTPVSVELATRFDAVVSFEHVIEKEKALHYVDALAAHMGITLPDGPESRRIQYKVSTAESVVAALKYGRTREVKRLGIQMNAGSRYRSYPKSQLGAVAIAFLERGYEVFLFGTKGDVQPHEKVKGLRDLTDAGLTFRQSVAALATCDVLLAPDSSLLHVSAAIGVPAVGLFAAIPAKMRMGYAPSITALEGSAKCSPCFWHVRGGQDFPKVGECAKIGRCEPLARISVESIVEAIEAKVAA